MRGSTLRTATAALAASCVLGAGLPGQAAAADGDGSGASPRPYRTAEDAQAVQGAANSIDGPQLRPGRYTDTLDAGERTYYTVELDDSSHGYVSAVLAPPPGTAVGSFDGFTLALEDTDGTVCDETEATFRSKNLSRPIAGHVVRYLEPDGACQEADLYVVRLERKGEDSGKAAWPVELQVMREPGVRGETPRNPTDPSLATEPPPQPTGSPQQVSGGTGFDDPPALGHGVWKDRLLPGETRFYKVPVGWDQQLFVRTAFSNAAEKGTFVFSALRMEVYNPARGLVAEADTSYNGEQRELSAATAPVAYANREESSSEVARASVAGWYYLAVTVHRDVASVAPNGVPFLLRIALKGEPGKGPRYDGDATEAGFGVTDEDREQAAKGLTDEEAAGGGDLRLLGYLSLGTGVALLLVLGGWTLLARRRAAVATPPGYAPPGYPPAR